MEVSDLDARNLCGLGAIDASAVNEAIQSITKLAIEGKADPNEAVRHIAAIAIAVADRAHGKLPPSMTPGSAWALMEEQSAQNVNAILRQGKEAAALRRETL